MADDYPIEQTSSGFQYLFPGTEKRTFPRSAKLEPPKEGDHYVFPGTEPISTRELLLRLARKPLQPRRAQRSLTGARLFRVHAR